MKRAATLVLVMLAMSASAAVDARALASEGPKTQWAPTRNFSTLNARAVFASESGAATSPYAGEGWETAAGGKEAGFTGHRIESALGLTYAKRRWLDSSTGTWLSRDDIGAGSYVMRPNELNPWQYAAGNPTRLTDPSGRYVDWGLFEGMEMQDAVVEGTSDQALVDQTTRGIAGGVGALGGLCALALGPSGCASLGLRGALTGLGWDGARQAVKQLEGGQQGFNWEEYGLAGGAGFVLGPVSRIPGAGPALMTAGVGLGLQSSWTELKAGNTATAFFDFSTTLYTPARGLQKRLDGSRSFTEFLKLGRSTSALTPEGFEVEIPPEPSRGPSAVATGDQIVLRNVSTGLDRTKPISASNPDYGSRKGRRGSLETRQDIDRIRDEFLRNNPDYRHVGGGTDQKTGLKVPEEYLRPSAGGRKGGAYADLTFEHRVTRQRIRINTVDVEAGGWMTDREAANFDRIFELTNEPIIALPKPAPPGVQLPQGTSVLP